MMTSGRYQSNVYFILLFPLLKLVHVAVIMLVMFALMGFCAMKIGARGVCVLCETVSCRMGPMGLNHRCLRLHMRLLQDCKQDREYALMTALVSTSRRAGVADVLVDRLAALPSKSESKLKWYQPQSQLKSTRIGSQVDPESERHPCILICLLMPSVLPFLL